MEVKEESPATPKAAEKEEKVFTMEDLKEHAHVSSCWILIKGNVYDVTSFIDEHPGGSEIVVESTGKDATSDFQDIGHSSVAEEMMEQYKIGVIKKE